MQDFSLLLSRYGWHLCLVGLLGTVVVGLLKKPLNTIIAKKFPIETNPISDQKFDTIAFILGFIVAALLGVSYTLLASNCFPDVITEIAGEEVVASYGITTYFTNVLGTWSFQLLFYQVWKKLGIKRLLVIIGSKLKASLVKLADKNGDGAVSVSEAAQTIQGFLTGGKINIAEVLSVAEGAIPGIVDEIMAQVTEEAGDAAAVNMSSNVDALALSAKELAAAIPQDKLATVVGAVVDAVEAKAQQVLAADSTEAKPVRNRTRVKF